MASAPTFAPSSIGWSTRRSTRPGCRTCSTNASLARDTFDMSTLRRIREEMERAEARRLQPHHIASFFLEAFKYLGGTIRQREPKRYQISHVPAVIRNAAALARPSRHRPARLRAHHLREGSGRGAGSAAGGLRLPRPPAARCDHRGDPRAASRPAEAAAPC